MRIDNADPWRDLLVFCGAVFGVLAIVALEVLFGATCEAMWRRIIDKLRRRKTE